ncbi:hypothetical protein UFOVP180_39 [uncultured Caudovirales phage]|uniref:Uncharacterized protein n=1 Tax=uncultured Caudovirales phage TaxID=2100421 RepID=A0A6J7WHY1_9CAUD|nr:hypothetical protein UFOVP180_39 [uncultured Caudovirales phage]
MNRAIDPLYRRWAHIRQVVYNPESPNYKNIGALGIRLDPRLEHFDDFKYLVEKHLGPVPAKPFNKLARIDQTKDFTIKNLEWTNQKNVGRRLPKSIKVKIGRTTKTLKEWSEIQDINFHTAYCRLERGWTPREALEL